jgi:ketosteroid isomerase-like protein
MGTAGRPAAEQRAGGSGTVRRMPTPHPDCQAADTVRALWNLFEARDWRGARALLSDDLLVELPATGERFTSADAFVAFNATYPEGWAIQLQRVVCGGASTTPSGDAADLVISEVQVPQGGVGVFAVAQFAWVRDGQIVAAREFWVTCGAEEPPSWRARLAERYDGRLAPLR